MLLELAGQGPLYRQVYDAFKSAILDDTLRAGEKMPSTRDLSQQYQCSRNTIVNAYEQLLCEGYLESVRGKGTFVSNLSQNTSPKKTSSASTSATKKLTKQAQFIEQQASYYLTTYRKAPKFNFKYGDVKLDQKSLHHWQRLLKKHTNNFEQNYDEVKGNQRLRLAIANHLRMHRGVHCDAEQIIITNGSQQALNLLARCFVSRGDLIITEDPCYLGSTLAFQSANANIKRLSVNNEGLDIRQYKGKAPKFIYLTPSHQYPTGVVMSAKRRLDVIDWANQHDCLIIEDDYDSEFRYEGRPISSIHNLDHYQRTIYVGTFSKSLYPALRIGYIVVPENLSNALTAWKWNEDRHCGSFVQPALAEFIDQGHYARHIKRMRNVYAEKRLHLKNCLEKYIGNKQTHSSSPAGLHLLVWLQDLNSKDLNRLLESGLEHDLGLYPVNHLYENPPENIGLVMGYTPLNLSQIKEGVIRLKKVIEALEN